MDTAKKSSTATLLDGGMGHQLKAMGIRIEGQVGSLTRFLGVAMANIKQPKLVRDAHLAFIDAGADIITTNSYAIVPRVYELCRKKAAQDASTTSEDASISLESMLKAACQAAQDARGMRPNRHILIAGSLPPLSESYRPDLVGPYQHNLEDYRRIVAVIAPHCDLILCETMSTSLEAKAACTAAFESGLPVYVSWTLDEKMPVLRSGETLEQAVAALQDIPVSAFLFNCTSPEIITKAIPLLVSLVPSKASIGAYANGFVTSTAGHGEYRDLSETDYYQRVSKWITAGATIVGGCCGIFPHHIAHIRHRLDEDDTDCLF